MSTFHNLWQAAMAETIPDPSGACGELMESLAAKLEVEQVEYSKVKHFAFFLLDLSALAFKGMEINVVMVAHPPKNQDEEFEQAQELATYKSTLQSIGFCFLVSLSMDKPDTFPEIPSHLDPIHFCGNDIQRILDSQKPTAVLIECIRSQVNLQRLCPFNTSHEARSDTFRGRKKELERLVYDVKTNFLVFGGRRIGKTSLLKKAYTVLRVMPEFWSSNRNEQRVFFFNCLNWRNFQDCAYQLSREIDPKKELRINKGDRNLSYLLQRRSFNGHKPLFLFFDEMDTVVDIDSSVGWPFFNLLAEAVAKNWIRTTFAGYRSMHKLQQAYNSTNGTERTSPGSPFYASLQTLLLEPLTKQESQSLLRDPFKAIGILLEDVTQMVQSAWENSAGNPWMIQFFGQQLFHKASEDENQTATLKHLNDILTGHQLTEFLLNHFLENTTVRGHVVACEQACVILFAHSNDDKPWAEGDFAAVIQSYSKQISLREIHQSLTNLFDTRIFSFMNDRYSFTLPLLKDKVRAAYPHATIVSQLFRTIPQ